MEQRYRNTKTAKCVVDSHCLLYREALVHRIRVLLLGMLCIALQECSSFCLTFSVAFYPFFQRFL